MFAPAAASVAQPGKKRHELYIRGLSMQSAGVFAVLLLALSGRLLNLNENQILGLNAFVLIVYLFLCATVVAYFLIKDAYNVWSPAVLFICSSALFFGFGPLAYNFGTEGTKMYLALRPPVAGPHEVNSAIMLSLVGQLGIYLGMIVAFASGGRGVSDAVKGRRPIIFSVSTVALIFTVVGALFKYLLYFPSIWGVIDLTIPGLLTQLNALTAIGFGLWAYVASKRGPLAVIVFLTFWSVDLAFTTLSFSKRWIVLAMVFPLAGYYLAKRNLVVTAILASLIALTYVLSQPMVIFARLQGGADGSVMGFADRAEIIEEYISEQPYLPEKYIYWGSQRWWTRLDASGRQAFAMHLYDRGEQSHSLDDLGIILIPRIFWPDKPEIEPPGKQFYKLVTGRTTSNMPATVYGDLYWQFGWLGLIIGCPIIGAIIGMTTLLIMPEIRRENFIYFPAMLIAIEASLLGANGFIINGFLISTPFFLIYLLLIRILASQMPNQLVAGKA